MRLKVERSRVNRNALSQRSMPDINNFADAALDLYQLLDELDIESIENI